MNDLTRMPDRITDGLQYDDDEFTGFCHAHSMAFTDYCEACDEDQQIEDRLQRERDAGDETVSVIGDIGRGLDTSLWEPYDEMRQQELDGAIEPMFSDADELEFQHEVKWKNFDGVEHE